MKQSLYFDRYLKILAPNLDVAADARVVGLGGVNDGPAQLNGESANGDDVVVVDVIV